VTAPHCGQRENAAVDEGEVDTRMSRLLSYQIDSRKNLAYEIRRKEEIERRKYDANSS
jgi:hypothetical protein